MFEIGKVYNKTQLHEQFGAQEISSMITQKRIPPIMIITGDKSKIYGDSGEWISEDTFVYTDHLMNSKLNLKPEVKEYSIDEGDVYLFKNLNDETVIFENKLKLVNLKIETGYDEEGWYTERIKYELKK